MTLPKRKAGGKKIPRAKTEQQKIPSVAKPSPFPIVLAQARRVDYTEARANARADCYVAPDVRREQQRVLQEAVNAYHLFSSLWCGLTSGPPSLYSAAIDTVPVVHVDILNVAMEKAVRDVAAALTCTFAGEQARAIERPNQCAAGPQNFYPSEKSVDLLGTPIRIGDRVIDEEMSGIAGLVYGVFADVIVIMVDQGDHAGTWDSTRGEVCQVLPNVVDPAERMKALEKHRPGRAFEEKRATVTETRRAEFARWQRTTRREDPGACVAEFVRDANNLLDRLSGYYAATKPLRTGSTPFEESHTKHFADMIEDILGEAATFISPQNPNADKDWQAQAYHLLRDTHPGSRYTYQPDNVPFIRTADSVDMAGTPISKNDRVFVGSEIGVVIYAADDRLLFLVEADHDIDRIGTVGSAHCRECRVLTRGNGGTLGQSDDVVTRFNDLREQREHRQAASDKAAQPAAAEGQQ